MKTAKLSKPSGAGRNCRFFQVHLFFLLSILLLLTSPSNLSAQFEEESVQAAYELRMNGEMWYAKAMLNKLIDMGRADGLTHYELARHKMHRMKGGWNTKIGNILTSATNAVSADPGNEAFAFFEAECYFLKAYMSMMRETETAREDIADAINSFERVLELKPDYHEARMHLVEIFYQLPEDMEGDKEKAEIHAVKLEEMDHYFGILAREIMLPEEASRIEYWQRIWKKNKEDPRIQKKLGLAYLSAGKPEESKPLFESAMEKDPKYNTLILHIARYHMYQVMSDRSKSETELPLAEAAIREYLSLEPEPIAPLKAWAIGSLSKMKFFGGEKEEGEKLMAEAQSLDPAFSRASAIPGLELYNPPGEIYRSGDYSSFLRPF
ncbi:MAG: tetratricopeptide repeat protein [Bacteroidales bacterium]|nr:tetratricopeptide repeat protein [Bacteroidales bacterium]